MVSNEVQSEGAWHASRKEGKDWRIAPDRNREGRGMTLEGEVEHRENFQIQGPLADKRAIPKGHKHIIENTHTAPAVSDIAMAPMANLISFIKAIHTSCSSITSPYLCQTSWVS
eukprot:6478443-Amphidinium_carterae.4